MAHIIERPSRRLFHREVLAVALGSLPVLGRAKASPVISQHAGATTHPLTAVSFPKEVIPVSGGRIEFWAKLAHGTTGGISVGGAECYFFEIVDDQNVYQVGFNGNDGAGNSGLVGVVGDSYHCGSQDSTYEDLFGVGQVTKWHHYSFRWKPHQSIHKNLIYVDGVLLTSTWSVVANNGFPALTDGTFNLLTTGGPSVSVSGPVQMQDLMIRDSHGTVILQNTLGSQEEVENSLVGLGGSFNGFGDAHFVANARHGRPALEATPVGGLQ